MSILVIVIHCFSGRWTPKQSAHSWEWMRHIYRCMLPWFLTHEGTTTRKLSLQRKKLSQEATTPTKVACKGSYFHAKEPSGKLYCCLFVSYFEPLTAHFSFRTLSTDVQWNKQIISQWKPCKKYLLEQKIISKHLLCTVLSTLKFDVFIRI